MNMETNKPKKVVSPSRAVWRTQMDKGKYTPHRVSLITCVVNQFLTEKIIDFLISIEITVYDETGRIIREYIRKRSFGLPGDKITFESSSTKLFRFTVQRQSAAAVMNALVHIGEFHIPGRGSLYSQELMEFSKEPPVLNTEALTEITKQFPEHELINNLACIICVLSDPGSGDQIARIALELGICVPVVTRGTGNDIRDQLGLIRITIPPEKEIVHLIMPDQDSDSVIKILIEEGKLDRPGKAFIYKTPVSSGLIDTRLKIGKQKYPATMEQIIAAIDQLKSDTSWRKRLDTEFEKSRITKTMKPQDNCEISIISDEARIDALRETCLEVGAAGAVSSNVNPVLISEETSITMIRSAISIPADITDKVVDRLLEISTINENNTERIQVLDSPAAYVRNGL